MKLTRFITLAAAAFAAIALAPALARAQTTLSLVSDRSCYKVGDTVTVSVRMGATMTPVWGGQYFITYDATKLAFVSAAAGDAPFTRTVYQNFAANPALDLATGVLDGGVGASAATTMARFTFTAIADTSCAAAGLVSFRATNPPSRLTDADGNPVPAALGSLNAIIIDTVAPSIVCPPGDSHDADAGQCSYTYPAGTYPAPATAMDACTASPVIAYTRSDNPLLTVYDPFPAGDTTVTWTATDCSGNVASCPQVIHVNAVNNIDVTVALANVSPGTYTRAITFDIYDNTPSCQIVQTVCRTMTFVNGLASDSFQVACGPHASITARDRLHTLRRTVDPLPLNTLPHPARYVAGFTGANALLGGNLNGDSYIDILDFGVFVGQWGMSPGPSTTCAQPPPFRHADIDGDGVVSVVDYTFISIHFLAFNDPDACGSTLGQDHPVSDISVFDLAARGEYEMARTADLNLDGRLNVQDMIFASNHQPPYCAADFNHSGAADIQDIFDFLSAWFNQHPAADIDDDHAITVPDIFNFLTTWFTGCP